ncbi:hypothetical protein [Motilimonas pumila]|nr:hypothetical protein [Motilimonas pumila]
MANIVDLSEDDRFRPLKNDDEQAQQLLKLIRHHRLVKRAFVAE